MAIPSPQDRIIAIFQHHFASSLWRINARYDIGHPGHVVIVRHYPSSMNMTQVLNVHTLDRVDELQYVAHIAEDMAQRFYYELAVHDPDNNATITPNGNDPAAQAIWALVNMVGGSLVARSTPVLKLGEENPWMLHLPRQGRLVPLDKESFERPLHWWQEFISSQIDFNKGVAQ